MSQQDDSMMDLSISGTGLLDSTQTVRTNRSRSSSARGTVIADMTTRSDMSSNIREAPSTSGSNGPSQLSDYQVRGCSC